MRHFSPADTAYMGCPPDPRLGDVAAMLRVMRPLTGGNNDEDTERRQLLADLFRLVGRQIGGPPLPATAPARRAAPAPRGASALSGPPGALASPIAASHPTVPEVDAPHAPQVAGLPPRLAQTLGLLLNGDSEKQVAHRLDLSPHTVHVYVKKLYKRFGVSSRAELLAQRLRR
jgi:DNA-binding CsgD family transcriptional regulator